jgi:hypothetical protein
VVESGTLLRCYTSNRGIEGSNPSSSASKAFSLQEELESGVEAGRSTRPFYTRKYTNAVVRDYSGQSVRPTKSDERTKVKANADLGLWSYVLLDLLLVLLGRSGAGRWAARRGSAGRRHG